MAPDKHQALVKLADLSKFLETSLASLATSTSSNSTLSSSNLSSDLSDTPAQVTVLSDISGLYTFISKETTALSLAFAPPSESWDAVHGTSAKLQELAGKLLYCLSLLRENQTNTEPLLAKEHRFGALSVLEALSELITTCYTTYNGLGRDQKTSASQRKRILTLTSAVWRTIERTATLPKTESEAFVKAWKSLQDMLQDGLDEVEDLTHRPVLDKGKSRAIEPANGSNDAEEDEESDFDDFGDEDDDSPLEFAEAQIVSSAFQLMNLVKALFKKLHSERAALEQTEGEEGYASVHAAGQKLLASQDDLASVLEPPLRNLEVGKMAESYRLAAVALSDVASGVLASDITSISDGMAKVSITTNGSADASAGLRAWLGHCKQQILRAASELESACSTPGR